MIDVEKAREQAEKNFMSGYNCTQSVLEVFLDECKIDREESLKAAQVFGGGTCRLREMCGTVSGMLLALGYIEGSSDPKDKSAKDNLYKKGQALCAEFKKRNGSFICRELLGLKPKEESQKTIASNTIDKNIVENDAYSPISEERTKEYYSKRPCPKLCGEAAAIFAEYLNSK